MLPLIFTENPVDTLITLDLSLIVWEGREVEDGMLSKCSSYFPEPMLHAMSQSKIV